MRAETITICMAALFFANMMKPVGVMYMCLLLWLLYLGVRLSSLFELIATGGCLHTAIDTLKGAASVWNRRRYPVANAFCPPDQPG
jgi:hypothetical protein